MKQLIKLGRVFYGIGIRLTLSHIYEHIKAMRVEYTNKKNFIFIVTNHLITRLLISNHRVCKGGKRKNSSKSILKSMNF